MEKMTHVWHVCVSCCFRTWMNWGALDVFCLDCFFHTTTFWGGDVQAHTKLLQNCVCVCVCEAPAVCINVFAVCTHAILTWAPPLWSCACGSPRCLRLIPDKSCQPAQTWAASSINARVGVVLVGDACVFNRVKMVVWVQHSGFLNKSTDKQKGNHSTGEQITKVEIWDSES